MVQRTGPMLFGSPGTTLAAFGGEFGSVHVFPTMTLCLNAHEYRLPRLDFEGRQVFFEKKKPGIPNISTKELLDLAQKNVGECAGWVEIWRAVIFAPHELKHCPIMHLSSRQEINTFGTMCFDKQ